MSRGTGYAAQSLPSVIIVGGGFAGIAAAKALRKSPVKVLLIDKVNHSLFQPLLYEVAGAVLDGGDIAFPIRAEFRNQKNIVVAMAELTGIDKSSKSVHVTNWPRPLVYDYLILATGVEVSYFGHEEWATHAPGMKTLSEGVKLRSMILKAFEDAERLEDPQSHQELTTFVLVGAGPTGCELAGNLAEMFRYTMKSDFRRFSPEMARIVLVEAGPRVLPMFSPELSEKARIKLDQLGVEVRLGHAVQQIDAEGLTVGGERIRSRNIIWSAGVRATTVGKWLGVGTDRLGRIKVAPDLTIPGHPSIFVVGDAAEIMQNGRALPGLAPVAIQSGRYAGEVIARKVAGKPVSPPFVYLDKGMLATISRNWAAMELGRLKLTGPIAKLAWAFVHIFSLLQTEDRMVVFLKWFYTYLTNKRGTRLIEKPIKEERKAADE
ncbi:MAG TPA: NAD(P)/FAD-dependent oxidoreductase [Nitrospirota bacterium]|nr:NAD(P)/FAD-dependent oxidoreductase [Nitrospirota bacterium]